MALSQQLELSQKTIVERETEMSKLRIEMRESGSKVLIVEVLIYCIETFYIRVPHIMKHFI